MLWADVTCSTHKVAYAQMVTCPFHLGLSINITFQTEQAVGQGFGAAFDKDKTVTYLKDKTLTYPQSQINYSTPPEGIMQLQDEKILAITYPSAKLDSTLYSLP